MWLRIENINGEFVPRKFIVTFLLKRIPDAILLDKQPDQWIEDLVCVIKNKHFEAACYAGNKLQMDLIIMNANNHKQWMIIPNAKQYAK